MEEQRGRTVGTELIELIRHDFGGAHITETRSQGSEDGGRNKKPGIYRAPQFTSIWRDFDVAAKTRIFQ